MATKLREILRSEPASELAMIEALSKLPAAGSFVSAGTFSGSMTAQISPGKSRWFERFHKDKNFHVDKCRVGFTAAW